MTLIYGETFFGLASPWGKLWGYLIFRPLYIAKTFFPSPDHIVCITKKLWYILLHISMGPWLCLKENFENFENSAFSPQKRVISYPTLKNFYLMFLRLKIYQPRYRTLQRIDVWYGKIKFLGSLQFCQKIGYKVGQNSQPQLMQ